jgi:hypothetical protein
MGKDGTRSRSRQKTSFGKSSNGNANTAAKIANWL